MVARIKGRDLLVEITVTQGVDNGKLKKIKGKHPERIVGHEARPATRRDRIRGVR